MMLERRSFFLLATLVLFVIAAVCDGAQPPKKKRIRQSRPIQAGGVYKFHLFGNEAKFAPRAARAGAIQEKAMILPTHVRVEGDPIDEAVYAQQRTQYVVAVDVGDKVGLDELVKSRGAFRVEEGDSLLVIRFASVFESMAGLPAGPGGSYKVRVVEGISKGAIIEAPSRNLIAIQAETAKPKARQKQ
jgi:hypothetical protein